MCQHVFFVVPELLPYVISEVQASGWLVKITMILIILVVIMSLPSVLNTLEMLVY